MLYSNLLVRNINQLLSAVHKSHTPPSCQIMVCQNTTTVP